MKEDPVIPQIKPETAMETPAEKPVVGNPEEVKDTLEARQVARVTEMAKTQPGFRVRLPKIPKKVLLGVGALLLVFILAWVVPALLIFAKAKGVVAGGKALQAAVAGQNITEIDQRVGEMHERMVGLSGTYKFLGWSRILPFWGGYYRDGEAAIHAGIYGLEAADLILEAVTPYADIIGFSGAADNATSGQENANDRIEFIVESLDELTPKMDGISEKVGRVRDEVNKIDPNRYPKVVGKIKLREELHRGITLIDEVADLVGRSKPLLTAAPYLLGIESPRTYLILFQNDKELRPTGGFITAYAIATVDKGKFEQVASNDIYNLDNKYRPSVPAPEPILKYIKGPYVLNKNLRLRDMNFDPDFSESMKLFTQEAAKVGIADIDGVIGVDTFVVVKLLDVLGQIGVPGFGNFSTKIIPECNCPQVIYELESFADVEGPVVWDPAGTGKIIYAPANYDNRKKIVGPLMNSVLSNALGQPKEKLPGLFEAMYLSMTEKHVLLYLFDEKAQAGVTAFNIAGTMKDYDGDYLHINDANLGGRKSNLYVSQEVVQEIKVNKDGSIEKTLELTYKNPQSHDGWLNSVLPNWTRIYVPKGSTLVDSEGFEERAEPYEEHGKTVFAGGFELRPEGVVKVRVTYKLPFRVGKEYKMLVQKQPGTDKPLYTIKLGRQEEELYLKGDREFRFRL